MASLPLRQIEGKYEILEKIKEGGMGAIYKVRHLLLDEIRVIKVIRPQIADSKDLQRRFAREARAAIRLKHPNIAQLYDFAVEPDGVAFMVMEFIDGVTLQEMLARNGPAQIDLTLEVARQGLQALRYLHLQGYVHRDIAPDNLMLSKDYDGKPLVKLIDLGIVKHLLEGAGDGLTATGMFLGKVRYSSPEQFSDEKGTLDHRSDIYSFGVMLYELLTGKCPIQGENLSHLVAAHLFQPPMSFELTDPQHRVPQEIRDVVLRALEKSPDKRLASAQEFHDLLSRHPPAETLVQDLDDTLSITIQRRQEGERPPAGTTQDKLDAQFGLVRTPRPEAGLHAVEPAGAGADAVTIERLLTDAQRLVAERQWEGARRTLYRALAIHPDHAEARRMLSSAESSLAQAIAEEKQRQQAIADAVESIGKLLRSEQLEQAVAALDAARSGYGEDARFASLSTRISELRGALAERERQFAISRAVASISELLERENAEEARVALAAAVAAHGAESRFTELASRAEQVAAALDQRRREQAIAARCAAIRGLLARENAQEAARMLEEARAEHGEETRFVQLHAELTALRAAIAERERQAALEESAAAIAEALGKEDVESAAEALRSAVARFGSEEWLAKLDDEIEQLRGRLAERQERELAAARRARAAELIAAAVEQGNRHHYGTAIAKAGEALELDPDSAEALRLLLAYRQAEVDEREKRRREQALNRAAAAIEALLEREAADDAAEALEQARHQLGDDVHLVELERRLFALRDRLAQRRQQAIAAAVDEIEAHLDAEAVDAAQRGLDAAIATLGEDDRLLAMRDRIGARRRELVAKERRLALAQAMARIEERVRAEEADAASTALKQAIERFGAEPPLLALRVAVIDLRQRIEEQARSKALAEVDRAARSSAAAERFDEAEKMLDGARHQYGSDPVLDRLAQHVARSRQECDERRRNEAVARAAAAIEEKVAREEADEAAASLAAAIADHGKDARFDALTKSIARLRRELAQRQKREQEAQAKREQEERAKREAEAQAKREQEERAKREAEAQAKREQEERAKREAEAQAKREQEERAKREAEARAKREQEERAKREAEAQAKREQEERAKREAEARAKHEQEERAKREAVAQAKREQEERAKREAEARAKREQEDRAKREAEAQAKREQEERAKREAEARAKREQEERAKREAVAQAKREQEERAKREAEARAKREQEERAKREAEAQAKREEAARPSEQPVPVPQVAAAREADRSRSRTGLAVAAAAAGVALVGGAIWLWPGSPAPPTAAEVASIDAPAPAVAVPEGAIVEAEPLRDAPAALPAPPLPSEPVSPRAGGAADEGAAASTTGATRAGSTSRGSERTQAQPRTSAPFATVASAQRGAEVSPPEPLAVEVLTSPPAAVDAQSRPASPSDAATGSGDPEPPPAPAVERPPQQASTPRAEPPPPQPGAGSRAAEAVAEKGDPIVVPPLLKSVPQPRLPALAERQRRQATVLVRVLIDESGNVLEAEVQGDDPDQRMFVEEALRVARKATFEPGTRDGVKSRMYSTIPIQFRSR